MPSWESKPIFLVAPAAGLEQSAAFTGAGFTSGEVGFFVQGTGANTGATITLPESLFFAAQKSSSAERFSTRSNPILAQRITQLGSSAYVAPVAEVWTVGFDGVTTTKTLSYDCDADYAMRLIAYSPYIRKFYNNQGFVQTYNIHTSCCDDCEGCSTSDCWAETAKFVKVINETPQASVPAKFVFAEMLLDGAASDVTTGLTDSTTATFTFGSPIVTFSGNQTIATGAYIRVSPSNVSAPTNADPVFKVAVGVTAGTQITLDTPWNRATDSGIVIDTTLSDTELAIVTTSAVTACGIQFTGKFISNTDGCCCFPPFPWDFEGVSFIVAKDIANSFPCSWDASQLTALNYGNGSSREVLYTEMDAAGYTDIRQWFLDCAANTGYHSSVVSTDTYDLYYLKSTNVFPTTSMGGNPTSVPQILIIAATNATPGTPGSTAATQLTALWASLATLTGVVVTT